MQSLFYVWDVLTGTLRDLTEEQFTSAGGQPKLTCEAGWIQSADCSKRLCWVAESMRAERTERLAIKDGLIALGAGSGRFTILDVSGLCD